MDLARWGGLAGVVAGVTYVMAWAVDVLFVPQGRWPGPIVLDSFSGYLAELIFAVALAATLVAIAGLHAAQRRRYGWAGAAGSLAAFFGHVLLLYATIETTVRGTDFQETIYTGFPIIHVIDTGLLISLVGMALLGLATLLARVLPRWCGFLLIVGYPLPVFFGIGYDGSAPFGVVPAILWASVGYALLSSGGALARQPTRVN